MNEATAAHNIKLIIADDHELVRDGIRARLAEQSDMTIVGEAANGLEAVELAQKIKPDVMLLDISMPRCNGLEATREIRQRGLPVKLLILSIYDNAEYVRSALQDGANGYILKDVSAVEMVNAIRSVASGGLHFSSKVAPSLLAKPESGPEDNVYGLTSRECDVLRCIATGFSNKEIARRLGISARTVESHRQNIRDKTGGGNAAFLTRVASEIGLL